MQTQYVLLNIQVAFRPVAVQLIKHRPKPFFFLSYDCFYRRPGAVESYDFC